MRKGIALILGPLVWLPTMVAALVFLREWFAPDSCLNEGGSFNYATWQCGHMHNAFIAVPFYRFGTFWLFVAGFVAGAVASGVLRSRSNAARG